MAISKPKNSCPGDHEIYNFCRVITILSVFRPLSGCREEDSLKNNANLPCDMVTP